MAQKTLDEWAADLQDLQDLAVVYRRLPHGEARNTLHALSLGLERLIDQAERGRPNRAAVAKSKAKRQGKPAFDQDPLWGTA